MANKSPSKSTVLLLILTLTIFSLACRYSPIAPLVFLDDYFGTNYVSRAYQATPKLPTVPAAAATEAILPATEAPAQPAVQATEVASPASATEASVPQPASASPANVIGGWYGAYCDEAEGTYYYRWSVDLMQNPADGSYAGTVKFHNCPGGGRVAYRVAGPAQPGPLISLNGTLMDGGGALHDTAAETLAFTFDLSSGQITPNLAP